MKAGWVMGGDKRADICKTSNNKGTFLKRKKNIFKADEFISVLFRRSPEFTNF